MLKLVYDITVVKQFYGGYIPTPAPLNPPPRSPHQCFVNQTLPLPPRLTFLPSPVFSFASDCPFVIERQVCSPSTKQQVSTTLHYTITVCGNRTAHSQYCLLASVEARELNLKYARATGELNPGSFDLAAECLTTRPPRPILDHPLKTSKEKKRLDVGLV